MAHAWLDSLSDDWVSQPGSDASADQLPPLPAHQDSRPHKRDSPSRIPKLTHSSKPVGALSNVSSPSVLSERSASDINISRRLSPSKLSQEVKFTSSKGDMRVISNESAGSVVHNEDAKPDSPEKDEQGTPEWKRRLVYGDMAYGEQKDLFCSAAAGLQDMFKPPAAPDPTAVIHNLPSEAHEMTLPSSPPPYPQPVTEADLEEYAEYEEEDFDYPADVTPSPSPRRLQKEIKYKLDDSSPIADSRNKDVASYDWTPEPAGENEIFRDESCMTAPQGDASSSRKPSGRSDILNEDFSPILIGKHSDDQGKVDFAPLEVPVDQLWQKLERLRVNQMLLDSQADLQGDLGPSPSKPADPETTMDYMRSGGFINVRRGGRSGDGSFYNRGLSSEIGADTSEMLPEESLQASTPKEFPSIRTWTTKSMPIFESPETSALPKAPYPSPEKDEVASQDARARSGSPLKLFGPYDTFTNQTLLRRISQFEERSDSQSRQSSNSVAADVAHDLQRGEGSDSFFRFSRRISQFGGKDLDGYEFTGDISDEIFEDPDDVDKENVAPQDISIPVYPFQSGAVYGDDSPESRSGLLVRRRRSKADGSSEMQGVMEDDFDGRRSQASLDGAYQREAELESKRPRTSPSKDPTPKRRRTLHRTDIAFARESRQSATTDSSVQMSLTPGKKRKDALPGGFELADPSVLALRNILQPRSPDSSRRASENLDQQNKKSPLRALQDDSLALLSDVPTETDRKPSIRTQDFVDQAAQIMAMIRNQVKPELGSLDESEEDPGPGSGDRPASPNDSLQDSTEPFSRPPSREGRPSTWSPPRQEDPEVTDKLKKYQEFSDMADIVSSSVRSMNLANDLRMKAGLPIPVVGDVVSDLPNVRITSNPFQGQENGLLGPEHLSNGSNRSGSHSYPSNSSRGSESRRIIRQENVSHLIPDKVGSMCLDKDKYVWIKQKGGATLPPHLRNIPPSDDSEEDPFASIPDLSVDMTREMQNLRLVAAQDAKRAEAHQALREHDGKVQEQSPKGIKAEEASPGTKKRNLTISFSSPVASIIRDISPDDYSYEERLDNSLEQLVDEPLKRSPQGRGDGAARFRQVSSRYGNFIPRPVSRIDEQDEESTVELPQDDRQVSILGDQSLVSHRTPNDRVTSFSMILSQTPGNGALALAPDDSALIGQNVGKLSLSPLSEFTLNNPDQSFGFEVSYVMGHRHMATGDGSRKVLSMAIRELVDRLGEAESHEAFWEDVTELDLHDKRLASLHMLDEFCGKLVTLDASANSLNHLDGVPSTVRELKVSRNLLTELTSWDHLMNLQYVDVSDNEVTSLSALKSLVHLRSVKADNNQLTSLDGMDSHDGLLSLRARNNLIEEVDFAMIKFDRLEELDLGGNCINSVHNLELLPALTRLKLAKNRLQRTPQVEDMRQLRHLDLSDNELTTLDVGGFPNLHSVHADRNYINKVGGFDRARRLDSLSLREQRGEVGLDMDFLSGAYEVRKLFLSGNLLEKFSPRVDFLNLQLLELANCGLQSLPEQMGQTMPNLRTLNINFNAVSDLRPLQYVPRLKKLLVAGNRLGDSTKVTRLLSEFPHLTQLDVRDNPMTLGFYAPLQVLVPQSGSELPDPFVLPAADVARDEAFAARLDEGTRLRRRLHQVVLVASCKRLRVLDGLSMRRRDVLARDSLLDTLIKDGLLLSEEASLAPTRGDSRKATDVHDADEDTIADDQARAQLEDEAEEAWQHNETLKSARWSREDSFA